MTAKTRTSDWLERLDGPARGEWEPGITKRPSQTEPRYAESAIFVALFGAVILIFSLPAFTGFFYGEDFEWMAAYFFHKGDFLKAIFSPMGSFAFRPAGAFWLLSTQLLLPWEPMLHHIRNFLFTLVNLLLLHRIMLRLTSSRVARGVGMAFFAISKVHLVTIGLLVTLPNIVAFLHFQLCTLFLIRHLQERKGTDYWLALFFFVLTVFTRDYSVVLLMVVLAIYFSVAQTNRLKGVTRLGVRTGFAGFVGVAAVYLGVRLHFVGLPPVGGSGRYGMGLHWAWIWEGMLAYAGNLLNLSISPFPSLMGVGDLSALFTNDARIQQAYGIVFLLAGSALIAWTTFGGIRRRWWSSFALIWTLLIIGPTFLVRYMQLYYIYESVGAAALFLALCLDRGAPGRGVMVGSWAFTLILIGANGYVTNENAGVQWWWELQEATSRIHADIFVPNQGRPVHSLTIVALTPELADSIESWINAHDRYHQIAMPRVMMSMELEKFEVVTAEENSHEDWTLRDDLDLVYFARGRYPWEAEAFRYTSMAPVVQGDCAGFEDRLDPLKSVWVVNTITRSEVNLNPTYVSEGHRSVGVSVTSDGSPDFHYGGVELPLPPSRQFMIDMWVDEPANLRSVYAYEMDDQGYAVNAWINNDPTYLMPGTMNSLMFQLGTGNVHGFEWIPQVRSGPAESLHFFVDVKQGKQVKFFVDRLCELKPSS